MICGEILFSDHAIGQMFKRNISVDDVKLVMNSGEIIATYLLDKPYPSYLMLGYIVKRPLHVVVAKNDDISRCTVVTAYEPDEAIWAYGFKSKIK